MRHRITSATSITLRRCVCVGNKIDRRFLAATLFSHIVLVSYHLVAVGRIENGQNVALL